jgi:hypothetical protein
MLTAPNLHFKRFKKADLHLLVRRMQRKPKGIKKMTKKDYEHIALSLRVDRDYLDDKGKGVADYLIAGLAKQLQSMNPRFNEGMFLDACGYGQN